MSNGALGAGAGFAKGFAQGFTGSREAAQQAQRQKAGQFLDLFSDILKLDPSQRGPAFRIGARAVGVDPDSATFKDVTKFLQAAKDEQLTAITSLLERGKIDDPVGTARLVISGAGGDVNAFFTMQKAIQGQQAETLATQTFAEVTGQKGRVISAGGKAEVEEARLPEPRIFPGEEVTPQRRERQILELRVRDQVLARLPPDSPQYKALAKDIELRAASITPDEFDPALFGAPRSVVFQRDFSVPGTGITFKQGDTFDVTSMEGQGMSLVTTLDPKTGEAVKVTIPDSVISKRDITQVVTDPEQIRRGAFEKARGTAEAKTSVEIQEAGTAARLQQGQLVAMEKAIEGFEPGAVGNTRLLAAQVARFLGVDPGDIPLGAPGSGEAIRSIGNLLALDVAKNIPAARGITNRMLTFIQDAVPNLTTTPEGVLLITELMRRTNAQAIKRAQLYKKHGADVSTAESEFEKWLEKNPLVDEAFANKLSSTARSAGRGGQPPPSDVLTKAKEHNPNAVFLRREGDEFIFHIPGTMETFGVLVQETQ